MDDDNDDGWSRHPTPAAHGSGSSAPEAYGRVTNPKRFAVLHDVATQLLQQLARDFDVERSEGYGIDPEVERGIRLARPTVTLTPRDGTAAAVAVAFSAFPGLRVRFGRWCTVTFPGCGCDACNENPDDEVIRLKWTVTSVIEGRFFEAIQIGVTDASTEWAFWSSDRSEHATVSGHREQVQNLLTESDRSWYAWKPWSRRGDGKSP